MQTCRQPGPSAFSESFEGLRLTSDAGSRKPQGEGALCVVPRESRGRAPAGAMAAVVAKREGPPFISEAAVRGNAAVLDYCRTSVSALSGATAGILGLTGLYGFIFYLLASILLSLLLILKAGRRWNKYFKSRRPLFTGGLIGGLFTYVLFWTFLYGMVHVY
ncbi:ER membrane protein complex subunit 6 [Sciurus carolinensis]|uniref:ER membrane protein complex subunit 6 n=1 Tax=Sciurus carolinensis TaxID=30640 RepID=A0AA41SY83_SCICA|nr:ER membrane protein complex subunit 6 [Sciurus carolinensis]